MKILILANNDVGLYKFRKELIETLLLQKYEVVICLPYGPYVDELQKLGCEFIDCNLLERRGTNPFQELKLLHFYKHIVKKIQPDIVFTYTIKPNVYGGMICGKLGVPYVTNITGLGTAVENGGIMNKITLFLYRKGVKKAQMVFFQNEENKKYMLDRHVVKGEYDLLPGSGVNLESFPLLPYPEDRKTVRFAFISRVMKEKGIDQYLEAARYIKKKYPNTEFHVCGFCEDEYEGQLEQMNVDGIVIYHGMIRDVSAFLKNIHCVVHPTYYPEGISNVLLEACASGRPIITTDRSGCREVVEDGVNGYMIPQKDEKSLIRVIEKFLQMSFEGRRQMGLAARKKVEKQFDRNVVVEAYMEEIYCSRR